MGTYRSLPNPSTLHPSLSLMPIIGFAPFDRGFDAVSIGMYIGLSAVHERPESVRGWGARTFSKKNI